MDVAQVYRTLLLLYPGDYRTWFGREMQSTFERAAEEHRVLGRAVFMRFLAGEFIGLLSGAGAEWMAKMMTARSVRERSLPDLTRPPGVSRELRLAENCAGHGKGPLPDEVAVAQARVRMLVERMVHAIAHHDFPGARRYSDEERVARDELRRVRQKYDMADSG